MAEQPLRFTGEYEKYFNPKVYLNKYYKTSEGDKEPDGYFLPFFLLKCHKFWSSLGSNNVSMLEFGGGPCIYTLISACPFVREIVFSEFTEGNRKEVEAWQKKERSSHDWSPIFKHVVQKLEGKSEEEAMTREEELRSKIARIIPCDIRQTNPLHPYESPTTDQQKFDVISSASCLESVVESDDIYCEAVAKLSQLLKPGGRLIMAGVLHDSIYEVGDQMFFGYPLNEPLIRRALDAAGIKDVEFVSISKGAVPKAFFFAYGVLK